MFSALYSTYAGSPGPNILTTFSKLDTVDDDIIADGEG